MLDGSHPLKISEKFKRLLSAGEPALQLATLVLPFLPPRGRHPCSPLRVSSSVIVPAPAGWQAWFGPVGVLVRRGVRPGETTSGFVWWEQQRDCRVNGLLKEFAEEHDHAVYAAPDSYPRGMLYTRARMEVVVSPWPCCRQFPGCDLFIKWPAWST